MNIDSLFASTTPVRWHVVLGLRPIERAQCFVVPLEEDVDQVRRAKDLVAEVIAGRTTNVGVRGKYSGADWKKGAAFDLAAEFFHDCYYAAGNMSDDMDPVTAGVWPNVEFNRCTPGKCCAVCESLDGKRLSRRSAAVRTFCPPWHFGCHYLLIDAQGPLTPDFTLSVKSAKIQYFHNPIDVLVSRGFCEDYEGIDFGEQTDETLDISGVGTKPREADSY
jgi:hypothetical protein